MRYYRRNPTDREIQYLRHLVNNAIADRRPLDERDMMLLQHFFDAIDEQKNRPSENVKDRAWRAAVYRRFLDDPEALEQFTKQALEKFGPEQLSMMVAPQLQIRIAERAFKEMPIEEVYKLLSENNRLPDLLDYVMEQDPDFVNKHMENAGSQTSHIEEIDELEPDQIEEDSWGPSPEEM